MSITRKLAAKTSRERWFKSRAQIAFSIVEPPSNPRGLLAHIPTDMRSKPVFNQSSWEFIDGRAGMYGDAFFLSTCGF